MLKRATRRFITSILGLVFLAPVLALLPASVCDIGPEPESSLRFSLFPLALAALDPLIGTSLWNSLALAFFVTAGSVAIGVAAGDAAARFEFWGRPVFWGLMIAPAVMVPAWSALGLLGLFGTAGPAGFGRMFDPVARSQGDPARVWPWLIWVWAALIQGVALVGLALNSASRRMNILEQDAARLAGARPLQVWCTFTWPAVRPAVAWAAYLIFMINLADPAAPLVLGLRRSLGYQMVVTALGSYPFPRLVALVAMVLALNLFAFLLAWWRGGAAFAPGRALNHSQEKRGSRSQTASLPRTFLSFVLYIAWLLFAWLPVGGLLKMGLSSLISPDHAPHQGRLAIASSFLSRFTTHPAPRLLAHSALLGLGVAAVLVLRAWRPSGGWNRGWRSTFDGLALLAPPLVAAAGVLAIGRTASLASRLCITGLSWPQAGLWLDRIALVFDPAFLPGLLVLVGSCLALLPRRLMMRRELPGHELATARQIDQLRIAGSARGSAAWQVWRRSQAIAPAKIVLWATLAATAVTPALILGPALESRPIGPGIVILADLPDDSRAQAAALALAAIIANLLALGWASTRPGRAGHLEPVDLA